MRNEFIQYSESNKISLNLHELSELSHVSYSTVYNLFTGKKSVRSAQSESLKRLAHALGLTMDELYDRLLELEGPVSAFSVYWEDEKVSDVSYGSGCVYVKRYTLNPAKQIFYADEIPRFIFGEIIKSRCWDAGRPDIAELTRQLGLKEYNIYEVIRKTHGLMAQDKIWFRFSGEKLTYKDVRGI